MVRLALHNPSTRTWWLIGGAALGAAAIGGTAWWLVRRRQEPTFFIPPMVWQAGVDGAGSGIGPIRVSEDETICQMWKTGNERRPWGPEHYAKVEAAVEASMDLNFEPYDSVQEARTVAFRVTAAALKALCPFWPVPTLASQVESYKNDPDLGFWWDATWDSVYASAWNRVFAEGGGSL